MSPTNVRRDWSRLNRLQLGKYAEYLAKMEFVLLGCDVFTSEVDDHGIDFVVRTRDARHFDVQVKSFRLPSKSTPYIFVPKDRFDISQSRLLALVQFVNGEDPNLFLLPAAVRTIPNPLLESRDYGEGKQSPPEWGLTLSKRKLEALAQHWRFESVVAALQGIADGCLDNESAIPLTVL